MESVYFRVGGPPIIFGKSVFDNCNRFKNTKPLGHAGGVRNMQARNPLSNLL